MDEPIKLFYSVAGFKTADISQWVIGDKYVAVMLKSGHIGVCATLGNEMSDDLFSTGIPDLNNTSDRIILNAYFNAVFNYKRQYTDIKDIFDRIDFSRHKKIVMVGYFETLFEKFSRNGLKLDVFDIHKESDILTDISSMEERLSEAGTIILTGTTVFNNTFKDIVNISPDGCNIFLLGPSNILSDEMFRYRNIKIVFGSVFNNSDRRVLNSISRGEGTRGFLSYLNKVYIIKDGYGNEIQ